MLKFGLLMETESIQFEQECAIKALGILVHDLEREIAAIKKEGFMPVDYLQDLSDALYSVYGTVDALSLKLKEAVDEEYQKRKGNKQ